MLNLPLVHKLVQGTLKWLSIFSPDIPSKDVSDVFALHDICISYPNS